MPDDIMPEDRKREDGFGTSEDDSLDESDDDEYRTEDDEDDPGDERSISERAKESSSKPTPARASVRRNADRKKRRERTKAADGGATERPRDSSRPRSNSNRSAKDEATDERAKISRRKGAPLPANKRRRPERKDAGGATFEILEPSVPPEPEVDLSGELEPAWEPGITIGGACCLTAVACAVVGLMVSGGEFAVLSVVGLVIVLLAIVLGGIGVLARKTWGYVLALGASGLGAVAGLVWTLNGIVNPQMSPWWPFAFFVFCVLGALTLFQMRWGPGPMADERERGRALKRRIGAYTTVQGELALSGSIAAVLATVLCGMLLMGNATADRKAGPAAQVQDGMALERLTAAPETNQMVLARWANEDYFFLGRVTQSRPGDEYRIVYLDGDEAWVRLADLRRDAIATGAAVHVHIQGHDGWLPAIVTQRSEERVEADVGAAQRVWVPLSMVRVREAS